MPIIEVQGVGEIEFPDDMSEAQIKSVLDAKFGKKQPSDTQGFGARLDQGIRGIPRQVGLAARYAIEGPVEALGVFTEPIRAGLNMIPGVDIEGSAADVGRAAADAFGLPSPEAGRERIVAEASKMLTGASPFIAGAGAAAKGAQGVTKAALERVAEAPLTQGVSAGTAGLSGGYVQETGGGPVAQFAASMAGGLAGAGATNAVQRLAGAASNLVNGLRSAKVTNAEINVRIDNMLKDSGLTLKQIPQAVRSQLAREVRRAMKTNREVDPVVLRRIADYGAVGATPTRGTVTLDPVQITQERNLTKMAANIDDPTVHELSRIQSENNAALISKINELGGAGTFAQDKIGAGEAVKGAIRARDEAARATERALYDRAKQSAGRSIPLDREQFVYDAYRRLAEENKGAFLPDNIKGLLAQIRGGKINVDGQEFEVPFNVDVIDNLKTTLAAASRSAGDGNTRRAIALVRDALENAPVAAKGRPVGGNQMAPAGIMEQLQSKADDMSKDALAAFDKARRFARARRTWQESAEGIRAALDEVPPDRFVQDFIIGGSNRASFQDVAKMAATVRRDPTAMQALRQSIVGFLKEKALSGNADEVANFSGTAFNKSLKQIGDGKLSLFFSPEEIAQLKAVGRVASYETFQPRGSAVNNSNTAGAVAGLLDRIAGNQWVGRLPLGAQAIQKPAQTWTAQIRAKEAMSPMNALLVPREAQRNALIPFATLPGLMIAPE